jgi:hypothetical protein
MRVFAFGLLLVGCSGGTESGAPLERATAGASSSGGALGAAGGGVGGPSAGGTAGTEAVAGAVSVGGGIGQAGAVSANAAGSGGAPGVAGAGGASVAFGGSVGIGGSVGGGQGGAGGSDPLAPFTLPGCDGYTAYRVPQGKYLAIWGSFENALFKDGACSVVGGAPYYVSCSAAGNVSQCVCDVSSPPSCGQSCDGAYLVTVLKAEPGKTFHTELRDGDGHCVAGVPVAK